MPKQKPRRPRTHPERRLSRSATKRGIVLRRPRHMGRMIAIALSAVGIVALALVWGSYLKAESDAFRQQVELGAWTLDPDMTVSHPVSVPDLRGLELRPGESLEELPADIYFGVILTLNREDGTLLYTSAVGREAGLPTAEEADDLNRDTERLEKRGLRVICAFTVTSFGEGNPALRAYRRGVELALLREYAEAGADDLLLFGLPAGGDAEDLATVEYLRDLRRILSDLKNPPAIGVALNPGSFATDATYDAEDNPHDPLTGLDKDAVPRYAGNITPARILGACDYLAMDLRGLNPDRMADILPHIRYAYVRYSLRLLTDKYNPSAAGEALSHGFERIFEMIP